MEAKNKMIRKRVVKIPVKKYENSNFTACFNCDNEFNNGDGWESVLYDEITKKPTEFVGYPVLKVCKKCAKNEKNAYRVFQKFYKKLHG